MMSVVTVTRFDKKVTLYTIRELRKMSPSGEMAEWFNATVLKTVVPRGTLSSNLSLSASYNQRPERGFLWARVEEGDFLCTLLVCTTIPQVLAIGTINEVITK
jgi:hypothetical protein